MATLHPVGQGGERDDCFQLGVSSGKGLKARQGTGSDGDFKSVLAGFFRSSDGDRVKTCGWRFSHMQAESGEAIGEGCLPIGQ